MLSDIFTTAKNSDPTILAGAIVPELGSTFRLGTDENFIYEACEYTDSFLSFYPHIAAVLNLELDHTDYFPNIEALERSFSKFVNNAGENGIAAYGVLMYINFVFISIFIGYSVGSAPIVSYHFGAQNHAELKSLRKKQIL